MIIYNCFTEGISEVLPPKIQNELLTEHGIFSPHIKVEAILRIFKELLMNTR